MTYVVAELGINHNGSLETALKLIDAAKWAGADAIKLQKRDIGIVYANQDHNAPRLWMDGSYIPFIEQKRRLELLEHEYDQINTYCKKVAKIDWSASAWDTPSLEFINRYDPPWHKVASAMATNQAFVSSVGACGIPVYLSTAMQTYSDIRQAIKDLSGCPVTLLHCIGSYPAPEKDLNLSIIGELRNKFGLPVGYSAHQSSLSPSVMAVVLGATVIEQHLTLDRAMYGSDQAASLEPLVFKNLVEQIRKVPIVMGDGIKRITDDERKTAQKLRYWE